MKPCTYCKLEVFLPPDCLEAVQEVLASVDAGHIGQYDHCLSYGPVTGCWRPLAGTNPYLGQPGELSRETELKVEVTLPLDLAPRAVAAVRAVHPYEEPVINVIPLYLGRELG